MEEEKRKNDVAKNIKKVGLATLNCAQMGVGALTILYNPIIGLPIVVDGALRLSNKITGAKINDSIITSHDSIMIKGKVYKNRITQSLNNITDILKPIGIRNKAEFLLTQELNFLLGAERYEADGSKKVYNTNSQRLTKTGLEIAQKLGLIENFECEETEKKKLIIPKILLGNFKNLTEEEQMYEMTFNFTDKEITDKEIKKFMRMANVITSFNNQKENKGQLSEGKKEETSAKSVHQFDSKKFKIKLDKEGKIKSVSHRQSYAWKETFGVIGKGIKNKIKTLGSNEKLTLSSNPEIETNNIESEKSNFTKQLENDSYKKEEIVQKDIDNNYKNEEEQIKNIKTQDDVSI